MSLGRPVIDKTGLDGLYSFTLDWTLQDMSAQTSACATAPTLVSGRPTAASSAGTADRFATSCGSVG